MSTSGVTAYALTVRQAIDAAMRKTGIMALGQSTSDDSTGSEFTEGLQALNLAMAELRGEGVNLWKVTNSTLTMVAGQNEYVISQPSKYNKIHQAWLQDNTSKAKIPIEVISIFNYNMLPLSTSNGYPIKLAYQPRNGDGILYIWPAPGAATIANKTLHISGETEIEMATSDTQTLDFPTEWMNALIYLTALNLAVENNVPLMDRSKLAEETRMHIDMAKSAHSENTSLYFQPYKRM